METLVFNVRGGGWGGVCLKNLVLSVSARTSFLPGYKPTQKAKLGALKTL